MTHELYLKQTFEILEQLETMGRDRKQRTALLVSAKDNLFLKKMFKFCYDWSIDWDFYYYEPNTKIVGNESLNENWVRFLNLITQLRNDDLGFIKHSTLAVEFMSMCSELEQKWYSRIINRELSVGVSWAIINNIWDDLIPRWGLAVASSLGSSDNVEYPIFAEPVVDGIRMGIVIKGDDVVVYTDNSRKYPILKFIAKEFLPNVKSGIIDGVITSPYLHYLNYKTKSITKEILDELCKSLIFVATDYFAFDAFYKVTDYEDKTPFVKRLEKLKQIVPIHNVNIKLNECVLVKTKEELLRLYQKSKHGLTLKTPSSTYINDFNSNWFIWKK